jgi:hypothetical protein
MAPRGYSSAQIAEHLGLHQSTVRLIAKEHGIALPADKAMRKARQRIDSNRVIRETVLGLVDGEMALDLVNFDELDTAEIEAWTTSLSKSIRRLSQLNKRLKEMIQ